MAYATVLRCEIGNIFEPIDPIDNAVPCVLKVNVKIQSSDADINKNKNNLFLIYLEIYEPALTVLPMKISFSFSLLY